MMPTIRNHAEKLIWRGFQAVAFLHHANQWIAP